MTSSSLSYSLTMTADIMPTRSLLPSPPPLDYHVELSNSWLATTVQSRCLTAVSVPVVEVGVGPAAVAAV